MTWSINFNGYVNLSGDAKTKFENDLVEKMRNLCDELYETEGCVVTSGFVTTNATGQVDLVHVT